MSNIAEHPCWDIPVPDDVPADAYVELIHIGWMTYYYWVVPVENGYTTIRELNLEEETILWKCEQENS